MELKKVRKLFYAIYIMIFISMLTLAVLKLLETWWASIIFILLGIDLLIWRIYWRCPHCGSHLGRMDYAPRCSSCGKKLNKK